MIDFDAIKLPDTGAYEMTTGATYVLTRPKQVKCRLIGNGSVVRYLVGNPDFSTGALETVSGCDTAACENIVFEIAPGSYALTGHGGFRGRSCQIHGGGGMYHLEGHTHKVQLISWATADTVKGSYAGYRGPKVIEDKAKGIYTIEQPGALELLTCEIRQGVTGKYHGIRNHGGVIRIHGGKFVFAPDPNHYTAAIRIHDAEECEVIGAEFIGSGGFAFGPLQDGDGGKNIAVPYTLKPDGKTKVYHYDQPLIKADLPKRNYYDAMRLKKLTIKDCKFDGMGYGDFRFNCGILDGTVSNTEILNNYGSSLIDVPAPYMNRPLSKLTMDHVTGTLSNGGAQPKFFSDDNGAKNIRVTNSSLQGKPYAH